MSAERTQHPRQAASNPKQPPLLTGTTPKSTRKYVDYHAKFPSPLTPEAPLGNAFTADTATGQPFLPTVAPLKRTGQN